MKVLGVIPVRYDSTRFPGKPLARVGGLPLIERVWKQASEAKRLEKLLVATDDPRIEEAVGRFGGEVVMTSKELASGTDRVWEATQRTSAEIIVNIQGDEPLVTPQMVDSLVAGLEQAPEAQMTTLRFPMKGADGAADPNVVKVVSSAAGWALYFSRSLIPARRGSPVEEHLWYKHLGLYAYRRQALEQFVGWPPSGLEKKEELEQLRALEHGMQIKVLDSPQDTIGVDTPEDIKRVEEILKTAGNT